MAERADVGDLVDVEPATVIGQRIGELGDMPELVKGMDAEDQHIQLFGALTARLGADWDRYLEA